MIRFEQKKDAPTPAPKKEKEPAGAEAPAPKKKEAAKRGKRPEKAEE